MDEREKIINIIQSVKYCETNNRCGECKYDKELDDYKDMSCGSLKAADALIAAGIRDITQEGYICMNGEVIVPTPNVYNKVADLLACPRIKDREIEGDVRGMIPDKIHLELTQVQYNQLMNGLCYARLYLKALIMYEQKEFGDTERLNTLIYEDTLKLFDDIQNQRLKELGW